MLTIVHTDVVDHRDGHMYNIWIQEMSNDSQCIVILDHNLSVLIYNGVNCYQARGSEIIPARIETYLYRRKNCQSNAKNEAISQSRLVP